MTSKYYALLTEIGAAKLANATALGTKLQITQMAVGDGGGKLPTPGAKQTTLVGEKRRAPLNSLSVDPANNSQIVAEQIIPESEGGYWIRELGLFDADNVLIAVANCPETYKPQLQEGSGRTQTVRMILVVSSTEAVTLKTDPSVVIATRKYVDDKVIEVKAFVDAGLAEKMDKAKNGADIDNVATFLKNLGMGEGAKLPAVSVSTSGGLIVKIPFLTSGNSINYLVIQMVTLTPVALTNGQSFTYSFPLAYDSEAWAILSETAGIISGGVSDEGMEIMSVSATGVAIASQWNSRPAGYAPIRLLIMGVKTNA
ncbi:phage tail protein [Erwinia sp. MYb416]|uniref:phage tail protein n=1 Tax=Erwinia sp. MYb416 TaxID=3108532 RepID=UPI00309C1C7F